MHACVVRFDLLGSSEVTGNGAPIENPDMISYRCVIQSKSLNAPVTDLLTHLSMVTKDNDDCDQELYIGLPFHP